MGKPEVSYSGSIEHVLEQIINDVRFIKGQRSRLKEQVDTLERALQDALCDCSLRHAEDVQLSHGRPGTHDFSCPFRRAMQPVLAAAQKE